MGRPQPCASSGLYWQNHLKTTALYSALSFKKVGTLTSVDQVATLCDGQVLAVGTILGCGKKLIMEQK